MNELIFYLNSDFGIYIFFLFNVIYHYTHVLYSAIIDA